MSTLKTLLVTLLVAVGHAWQAEFAKQQSLDFGGITSLAVLPFEAGPAAGLFPRQTDFCPSPSHVCTSNSKCCEPDHVCTAGTCCKSGMAGDYKCGCFDPSYQQCCPVSTYVADYNGPVTTQTLTVFAPPPAFSSADFSCPGVLFGNGQGDFLYWNADCLLTLAPESTIPSDGTFDQYDFTLINKTCCETTGLPTASIMVSVSTDLVTETHNGVVEVTPSITCTATTVTDCQRNILSLADDCSMSVSIVASSRKSCPTSASTPKYDPPLSQIVCGASRSTPSNGPIATTTSASNGPTATIATASNGPGASVATVSSGPEATIATISNGPEATIASAPSGIGGAPTIAVAGAASLASLSTALTWCSLLALYLACVI